LASSTTYRKDSVNSAAGLESRLNPKEALRDIEDLLRGERVEERFDAKKQEYVEKRVKMGKPLLNEQGISGVMRELRSRISKTNIQANTTKEHLHRFMRITHKNLAILLMRNREEWGWDTIADYHQLVNIVSDATFFALSRTIDDKERKHNSDSVEVKETITDGAKSWFG